MGGFYGSVQVRTEDRQAVVAAVTAIAKSGGIRCLIGPLLDGWVGVYPQGAGQDQRIGETIARGIGAEVLQAVVHDDDVMTYWFWHQGELADSYWSNPGYFNPADRAAQERMSGDPRAFGDLMIFRGEEMARVLARNNRDLTFEATRLRQFTELLGIHNAVTSYEYLKAGERAGIRAWDEFEEVPQDAVIAEQTAIRQREQKIDRKKQELKERGLLLAEIVEDRLMPRACAAGGGLLVAWEGYGRGEARVELYRPPWGDAEPGEIETGGNVNSLASDAAGRRIAMGLGNRVVVWEVDGWRPILELIENEWAVETALSDDGKLLAYACRAGVYVHEIDSGKRLTALSAHGGPALAFHPDGQWLLSAGNALRIARIRASEPWRELYPGGQAPLPPELAQAVQKQMSHVDVDALQAKWKTAIEGAVQKMAAVGGHSAASEQLVAKIRQQMEKQLEEMRMKFASLKAGHIPPPRQANETVLCAGFTRDGRRLWLGTDHGLRVHDWASIESALPNSATPRPLHSYIPASTSPLIYAATEASLRGSLLFGGYNGKLFEMDMSSGHTRELAATPAGGAITAITLAPDASVAALCSRPALGESGDPQDERAVWEIWSYPRLISGGKGTPTT